MKKLFLLFISLIIILTGCESLSDDYIAPEQPHLYWKTINVKVTNIDKRQWFAKVARYEMSITVKSKKYGLEETFEESGQGVFGVPEYWDLQEGDIIKAELYSWKIDSTGEIVRREINSLK